MLVLERIFQNDKYTIGKLYDGDTYLCDTLEPPKNVNHLVLILVRTESGISIQTSSEEKCRSCCKLTDV